MGRTTTTRTTMKGTSFWRANQISKQRRKREGREERSGMRERGEKVLIIKEAEREEKEGKEGRKRGKTLISVSKQD